MKKICSLVALLLTFVVTTVQAQQRWSIAENSTTEIQAGEDHQYVLREGFNNNGWSHSDYLNSSTNDAISDVDASCIYSFIEVGEKIDNGQTYKIYVLKNLAKNQYLSYTAGLYDSSISKAFRFTARKAYEYEDDEWEPNNWSFYSNACRGSRCAGAEDAGAWILCSPENRIYIGFMGNPSFKEYTDTNNWLILEATEEKLSAFEKMMAIYDEYIKNDVNEENYPVGDTPGCITQDLYDSLKSVYDEALDATTKGEAGIAASECDRIRESIIAVFDRYAKEMVPVHNGYYLLVNKRSMDAAYDGGKIAKCQMGMEKPENWTLENTKYIWQVVESGESGKFYLKNWGTGKYMGKAARQSATCAMVADSTVKFTAPQLLGHWFRLHDGDMFIHNNSRGEIVHWNATTDGNQWRFNPVPSDTIAKLQALVDQKHMTERLHTLVDKVSSDLESVMTKCGITFDGKYKWNAPGLVTEFEAANATETKEGTPEGAFDGDLTTYYHTAYHEGLAPEDDWHWVQVDFGKQVKEIYVKFSHRQNNNMGNPTRYAFVAAEDDNLNAEKWLDTLAKDTAIYEYSTAYPTGVKAATTCIQKVTFTRPVQHVRFVVTRTQTNSIHGIGPCWHVSEIRFYDVADCVENPMYTLVPQNIKDVLQQTMEKAKAEIDSNTATQETYDALNAAAEEFWNAYPDPTALVDQLANATRRAESAVAGDGIGYYEAGASEALLKVVAAIQAKMDDHVLSLDEIVTCENELDAALAAFNSKFHSLESKKIYRMVGHAFSEENSETENETSNSCVCSVNADINATPVWRYKAYDEEIVNRFNTLWYVEKDDAGYTFKNLANGYYIGNPYEGLTEEEIKNLDFQDVGYSVTPKHFAIEGGYEAGTFVVVMKKGEYLNLQPGGNLVHWMGREGHSVFDFEEVAASDLSEFWKIDVPGGNSTIVSLPMDIAAAYTESNVAMKAKGLFDGKIQFDPYENGEIIPAGTPFLIVTNAKDEETNTAAENFFTAELPSSDFEDNINLSYNYSPISQNGMVSAPCKFSLEPGFGYTFQNQVYISTGGEVVEASRGFFNKDLPTVESAGAYSLVLNGSVNGEGTGVEHISIVKNAVSTDVYSISGVLVRHNVKAGVATKNLPKGVYIVGGKKVIVK